MILTIFLPFVLIYPEYRRNGAMDTALRLLEYNNLQMKVEEMQLIIEGQRHDFVPIKDFRAEQGLPAEFGMALFEPKDYTGLGRIDRAGAELNAVREAVLDAIPGKLPLPAWMAFLPELTRLFQSKLYEINPRVGLKDVEVDFAVAGFHDVCQALLYAMLRAHTGGAPQPEFRHVYDEWLNSSTRLFSEVYGYEHRGQHWRIRVVAHAYGRAGLIIDTGEVRHYVHDPALGCPAEGFMASLLGEVAARILGAAGE